VAARRSDGRVKPTTASPASAASTAARRQADAEEPFRAWLESAPGAMVIVDGTEIDSPLAAVETALKPRPEQVAAGRGLTLVDALARDWGTLPTCDGKIVWFTLTTGAQAQSRWGDGSSGIE
jgi:hypothetical protein